MPQPLTLAPPGRANPWRVWAPVAGAYAAGAGVLSANEHVWDLLVWEVLGLERGSRVGESVHFFLYDTVKIALLLAGIMFAVTLLRSYVTPARMRALLGGRRGGVDNAVAATLGMAAPFCSCSAVPGFIGLVAAGVPVGVTLSFLIASPLVNEVAVVLLWTSVGAGPALLYAATGFAIAVGAGLVIGRLRPERWVEPFVLEQGQRGLLLAPGVAPTAAMRRDQARDQTVALVRKVAPFVVAGIAVGAVIHGWVPADLIARFAGPDNPAAVPLAVALGVPLYSGAAGVLPLVEALFAKGIPIGTLLAFMMATVALSVPEMVILRRVLRPRLIAVFVGVVAAGIVASGYLFNAVL